MDDNTEEYFEFFLKDICKLNDELIVFIKAKCKDFNEFIQQFKTEQWVKNKLDNNTRERIVQLITAHRRAELELEEFEMIYGLGDTKFDDFCEYSNKYHSEIDEEIKEARKKIYENVWRIHLKRKDKQMLSETALAVFSNNALTVAKKIVPLIKQLAEKNPTLMKNLMFNCDELVTYLAELDLVRGTVLSNVLIFSAISCFCIGKNFWKLIKRESSVQEFIVSSGIDIAANAITTLINATCGLIGGALCLLIPGVGPLIGSVAGSIFGAWLSNKYIDPIVRKILAGESPIERLTKEMEGEVDETLYKASLQKFNANENTPNKNIKDLRRIYVLNFHPDKQSKLESRGVLDDQTKKFIELESAFKIIEAYRKAKGTWN